MKKVAIDLTWVRHNKVGGTESCVRNLLNGIAVLKQSDIYFTLLVTEDNAESFSEYNKYNIFSIVQCDTVSESQIKRLLWQNTKMGKMLKKLGINICLEPIYSMPFLFKCKVRYIVTIHDLQAIHYPEYFNLFRNIWMRISWWYSVHFSKKIITISQYVKDDVLRHFNIKNEKVAVIYDAIDIDDSNISKEAEKEFLNKYGLVNKDFYYTVSSLLPHKNLTTLIKAMAILKKKEPMSFKKLAISGIGGKTKPELEQLILQNDLTYDIIFTDFVSNLERNILYKNCVAFLFPSIFEGFGMPPIEALAFGTPVVTTDKTSIPEVTKGLCKYVSNPLSPEDWAKEIADVYMSPNKMPVQEIEQLIKIYQPKRIAEKYVDMIKNI